MIHILYLNDKIMIVKQIHIFVFKK